MNLNIKTIIICIGLIIIVYLLMLFKEKFHPNLQVEGNKIDIPSHDINNVDYDNYMKVGDGIEGDVSDNSLPYDKINICDVCKTNKCGGEDCIQCEKICKKSTDIKSILNSITPEVDNDLLNSITPEVDNDLLNSITPEVDNDLLNSITPEVDNDLLNSITPEFASLPTYIEQAQKQETEAKYALISIKDFFNIK